MNPKIIFLILSIGCLILSGFSSNGKTIRDKQEGLPVGNKTPSIGPSEKQTPGRAVYEKYCLTCHQSNGSGVPGMYPPLQKGSWVGKDAKDLIVVLLSGLSGTIEVNEDTYKNSMPSQSKLTDTELAEVLTYIRSNFGNNSKPVTADMVKRARTELKK